ncbi:MAG TPA: flagellar filament capping protein FliD [Steroidobacteraceae bacterium]|jgi:flagellar hook-associated protein 2|nr:flagellar filament capping protein FliD [Steroidobacteraceae bacterium]
MAGLSSPGLGSGLDINSLVTQLVAAEKATPQKQITREQTSAVTTISALGNLKGALGAFNTALTNLKTLDSFGGRTASSSKPEVFTASASATASAGVYEIEVVQVASTAQIRSNQFATGAGQAVGTGTLTIKVGAQNFQVAVDPAHNTLAGIRDAINQASGNTDFVRATIVNATDGAHLVLTGTASGEANAITVAQADGDGGLASLVYNPDLTTNYSVDSRLAQDSIVAVAGFAKHSATTTVTDVIDGISLTLLKKDEGNIHTLTVANDKSTVTARIKTFVDQYNSMVTTLAGLRSYEPTTKAAGPLLGDAMLRGIETEIRRQLTDTSGGSSVFRTLASVGVTTQKNGSLALDSTKLGAALDSNYDEVAKLFGAENGVATRLSAAIAPRLAADSDLDIRSKRLNQQSVDLQKKQAALDTRMAAVEARYRKQFTALDSLLSNLQSTSSFLTQQLDSIAKISANK